MSHQGGTDRIKPLYESRRKQVNGIHLRQVTPSVASKKSREERDPFGPIGREEMINYQILLGYALFQCAVALLLFLV